MNVGSYFKSRHDDSSKYKNLEENGLQGVEIVWLCYNSATM